MRARPRSWRARRMFVPVREEFLRWKEEALLAQLAEAHLSLDGDQQRGVEHMLKQDLAQIRVLLAERGLLPLTSLPS